MQYHISFENPLSHFVNIRLLLTDLDSDLTRLYLPIWRPGRYEIANYAKNIQKMEICTSNGRRIPFKKVSGSCWDVPTKNTNSIEVDYNYYACQMDAGGSWLDIHQLYLNFINCLIYDKDRITQPCQVHLDLPVGYRIACSLPSYERILNAGSYYELVDSPMIASNKLEHFSYETANTIFHLWVMGENSLDWDTLLSSFKAFSQVQYKMMQEFPFSEYHFLYQIPYKKVYHGVEHATSTVIALGPGDEMKSQNMKESLLGVSSHELFHAWNVIRIRPKEMMPYDFSQENYFTTGFVAEGITTYYGDLFLVRSGVFDKKQYFKKLDILCKRHFENYGRFNHSLTQSSFDLWLDGYDKGIPNRKVSIYTKGALVALILDLSIIKYTDHQKSLDDLVRSLWKQYGQPGTGYSLEDYQSVAEKTAGKPLQDYMDQYILGNTPLENSLTNLLPEVGCELWISPNKEKSKDLFGFGAVIRDGLAVVNNIAPGSPAEALLSLDDQILKIHGTTVEDKLNPLISGQSVEMELIRQGKIIQVILESQKAGYYPQVKIKQNPKASPAQKGGFEKWLRCKW